MPESTGDQSVREWKVLETFGPVFSHGGFKNWYLCVTKSGIVAVPVGFKPTLLAGIAAGTGQIHLMQAAFARPADAEVERVLADEGNAKWRRYPIEQLERVFMKRCLFSANEIQLKLIGQKHDRYGLGDRSQTKACRESLRNSFPQLYSDKGFKQSE